MIDISQKKGDSLLIDWGIEGWEGAADCRYLMWNNCCVFCLRATGELIQIHMAMRPGKRHLCRIAVSELIDMFGNLTMVAPILIKNKSVKNLAVKMGFELSVENYLNGKEIVDIYVRYPDGFTN